MNITLNYTAQSKEEFLELVRELGGTTTRTVKASTKGEWEVEYNNKYGKNFRATLEEQDAIKNNIMTREDVIKCRLNIDNHENDGKVTYANITGLDDFGDEEELTTRQ